MTPESKGILLGRALNDFPTREALERIAFLEAELKLRNDELRAIRYTIVVTVGGTDYEGFATSEINWLQRLRILVEKERVAESIKEIKP